MLKTMFDIKGNSRDPGIAPQRFAVFVFGKISYIIEQAAAYPLVLYRWFNRQFAELKTVILSE